MRALLVCLLTLSFSCAGFCGVKPASIFGDHMVLQRNQPLPIWGTAAPGETVTVELASQKKAVAADPNGQWRLTLDPLSEGEGLTLRITGSVNPEPVQFADVAMGEVWLCSGQSNMEFPVSGLTDKQTVVAQAARPKIRLFRVPHAPSSVPATSINAKWEVCSPETIPDFSAVAYFFGVEIQNRLNVPIGLIQSTRGGSGAALWTPPQALATVPELAGVFGTRNKELPPESPEMRQKLTSLIAAWDESFNALMASAGQPSPEWLDPLARLKGWRAMESPGSWETSRFHLQLRGSMWLRKVVDVPAEAVSKPATLILDTIDEYDFTWINEKLVGQTGKETPDAASVSRRYAIPAGTFKSGKNVILVRILNRLEDGGFTGKNPNFRLAFDSGPDIALGGPWTYQVEKDLGIRPGTPANPWSNPKFSSVPGVLFDGMIAPLIPYAMRGVIWYQGEGNASNSVLAQQYRKLFPTLITSWRELWGQGDFPFYFVQLANLYPQSDTPQESSWAKLRESQFKTLALPRTGMAVAIDIGDAGTIHPRNKLDVGKRLSLWALALDYDIKNADGTPLVHSGPLYKSMQVEGSSIRLQFDHVGGGLVGKGGTPLKGFAIAGNDKKFVWAEAKIDGQTVIVQSPEVTQPAAVRYNWANNPAGNLYNANELPASPFRTDNW